MDFIQTMLPNIRQTVGGEFKKKVAQKMGDFLEGKTV